MATINVFSSVNSILSDPQYYAVPDYQREYEWTDYETNTLFEDILEIMNYNIKLPIEVRKREPKKHFLGAIVTIDYDSSINFSQGIELTNYTGLGEDSVSHILDGQQRLTSLSLLFKALLKVIEEDDSFNDESGKDPLKEPIQSILTGARLLTEKTTGTRRAPRLILNSETAKFYNKLLGIIGSDADMRYKGPQLMKKAYDNFKAHIEEKRDEYIQNGTVKDAFDFYDELSRTILNDMLLVNIHCEGTTDAFQVFDSLNGKGLDLTAADRIKNIFISWSPAKNRALSDWNNTVGNIDENDLVNFFTLRSFYINEGRIPKSLIPDDFKKSSRKIATTDYSKFCYNLKKDAEIYTMLKKATSKNNEVNELLKDFSAINQVQAFTLLFATYKHYEHEDGFLKDFLNLARSLFNLVVRMQVCDKNPNRLDSIFSAIIKDIKNGNTSLKSIPKQLDAEKTKMIDDKTFKSSFNFFAPKNNTVSEVYMRYLENYKRKIKNNRNAIKRGEATLEHIMPRVCDLDEWYEGDKVPDIVEANYDDYLQNIGNKLLLFKDDNSGAKNKIYSKKINYYKHGKNGQNKGTPEGTFELVKELLADYKTKFRDEEVLERAKKLSEIAVEIW